MSKHCKCESSIYKQFSTRFEILRSFYLRSKCKNDIVKIIPPTVVVPCPGPTPLPPPGGTNSSVVVVAPKEET